MLSICTRCFIKVQRKHIDKARNCLGKTRRSGANDSIKKTYTKHIFTHLHAHTNSNCGDNSGVRVYICVCVFVFVFMWLCAKATVINDRLNTNQLKLFLPEIKEKKLRQERRPQWQQRQEENGEDEWTNECAYNAFTHAHLKSVHKIVYLRAPSYYVMQVTRASRFVFVIAIVL